MQSSITADRRPLILGMGMALASAFVYLFIAYFLERSNFGWLFTGISLLFLFYFILLKKSDQLSATFLFSTAFLFRLLFIGSTPALSDDFYRFIWDGNLLLNGFDPYAGIPADFSGSIPNKDLLLKKMNSPNYYSVYPPVLQFIFAFTSWLHPSSLLWPIVGMRSIIVLSELGSFWLLKKLFKRFSFPESKLWLYFLNPLVIIELTGNLHFEAVMIFFSLLSLYLLMNKRSVVLCALVFALAFLSKLIPLLMIPLFWKRYGWKRSIVFSLLFAAFCFLLFLSITGIETILNIADSLDLYFRKFEFNASIYYLFNSLAYQWKGFNMIGIIGPALALISVMGSIYFLILKKSENTKAQLMNLLFSISLYYFLSTTVHPWYLSFMIILSLFTYWKYPILWSYLVFLSYSAYSSAPVNESIFALLLQYIPLYFYLAWEMKHHSRSFQFSK